jgi:hypothetical protein
MRRSVLGRTGRAAVAAALALGAILAPTPAAWGQAAGDQYLPSLDPGGTTGGPADPTGAAPLVPVRKDVSPSKQLTPPTHEGTASGGSIPGSDYPISPFVAIVAALLLAGIAIGVLGPVLKRRLAGARPS